MRPLDVINRNIYYPPEEGPFWLKIIDEIVSNPPHLGFPMAALYGLFASNPNKPIPSSKLSSYMVDELGYSNETLYRGLRQLRKHGYIEKLRTGLYRLKNPLEGGGK